LQLRSLFRRRPSAAMVIALVALFVSLGGAGYAAMIIPNNSVGTSQLKNDAVSYKKIQPRAVGRVRANLDQVQARVSGKCGQFSGVGSIDSAGKVSCNPSLPPQAGVVNTATVPATLTPVNQLLLQRSGSYLAWANPSATVTGNGTAQRVTVNCTLTVGSSTQTRSATINTGTSTAASHASIALQLAGSSGNSGVSCSSSSDSVAHPAAVSVTSALNTIQTS
jgi:hypothetical protein